MAPNSLSDCTGILNEDEFQDETQLENISRSTKSSERKLQLVWRNIVLFSYLHLSSIYGIYLMFTSAKLATSIFAIFLYLFGMFGMTGGAHRLWAHRAYKAKWPYKLILIIANTIAFEDAVMDWARDHRLHHKYTETDADPHNANRGFFFAHVGWLLCRKHPLVKEKGKNIDLSDLKEDRLVMFQKKYYMILMPLLCFAMPTFVPWYFWNETLKNAWHVSTLWRYAWTLNSAWLVNSAAHLWGPRPYDKYLNPTENRFVSFFALGEGWHNYHHVFPWDYKTAELSNRINMTARLINLFAKIGWTYDLRTVSDDMIRKRVMRTGDGSHPIWGWGDKDQTVENMKQATILNPEKEKST